MAVTQRVSSGAILEADSNAGGSEIAGGFVVVGAAATVFGVVASVVDVTPSLDLEMLDDTLQATGGGRAFLGGFLGFDLSFTLDWDQKETQGAAIWTPHQIWQDFWNGIRRAYRLTFSPGTTGAVRLACLFLVDKISRPRPVGQILRHTVDLVGCGSTVSGGPIVKDTKP